MEFDKRVKANSALNALRLIYKYQLSGQVYNVACQLLKELEAQTQQQLFLLTEVDSCLAELQTWFIQQYPLESMPADLLKNYLSPRVNTVMLLKEVEEWVGTTRYEWADLDGHMTASLKSQLLMHLQPICWNFYTECCQLDKK